KLAQAGDNKITSPFWACCSAVAKASSSVAKFSVGQWPLTAAEILPPSAPKVSTAAAYFWQAAASGLKSWPLPSPPASNQILPLISGPRPLMAARVEPTLV